HYATSRGPWYSTLQASASLGISCTAVVSLLWYRLIAEIGAARATVVTYVNPAVAVGLGVLLLDEPLSGGGIAGLLLILAGSWVSTGGTLPPRLLRRAPAAEPAAAEGPGALVPSTGWCCVR